MKRISPGHAALMISQLPRNGQLFSCKWIKKNGEVRFGTFRLAETMSKDKTGEGLKFDPTKKGLLVVYDTRKKAYRMITVSTIVEMKIDREEYLIVRDSTLQPTPAELPF